MPPLEKSDLLRNRVIFREQLHRWYERNHRKLPWRVRPSLYKTVVSEFMLQQTQVQTVLPYFKRWMEAFPDFAALAAAAESEALKQWEGLGYYSRPRNLLKLAGIIVRKKETPTTAREWESLPGVGKYTAAAVTSICFGEKAACLDGNVIRILARLRADKTVYPDKAAAIKSFAPLARKLLDEENPGRHNQALMELGATLCGRRNPQCSRCPVLAFCLAGKGGNPESFPRLAPKSITRTRINRLFVVARNCLLLYRTPAQNKRLAEIHEMPRKEYLPPRRLREPLLAKKTRAIGNNRMTEYIYRSSSDRSLQRAVSQSADLHWVPLDQLDRITLSGPHRRWIREILDRVTPQPD